MHQSAIVIVDRPARSFAAAIAASLESLGVWVAVRGFELAPDTHETADLVILGAAARSLHTQEAEAVRSWLMINRARYRGQCAAAFELQRGGVRWPGATMASDVLRAMSTRGFDIASGPISLRVADDEGDPATGQVVRAQEWARTLAEQSTCCATSARVPVGSVQRH